MTASAFDFDFDFHLNPFPRGKRGLSQTLLGRGLAYVAGNGSGGRTKGSHFEREVIIWGVRWYVAYSISYRQLEEMMEERGVEALREHGADIVIQGLQEVDAAESL